MNVQSHTESGAPRSVPPPGAIPGKNGGWLTPIKKGQALNPGGRSGKLREIQRACAALAMETVEFLVGVMRDEREDTRNRIVAALEINNRGLGKPKELPDDKPRTTLDTSKLSTAEVKMLLDIIARAAVQVQDAEEPAEPPVVDGQAVEEPQA